MESETSTTTQQTETSKANGETTTAQDQVSTPISAKISKYVAYDRLQG
jgi:hypothetical protein